MTTPITMHNNPQATFPAPLGLEQVFGYQYPTAQFPVQYPAMGFTGQQFPYGIQSQYPATQLPVSYNGVYQVQQLVAQILPTVYQAILPQVVTLATQQIQHQLQQLISQQFGWTRQWGL